MYYKYSDYLKEKYDEKVYKIPVNLPVSCPNRDGTCGQGGCIYCGGSGADFEMLSPSLSVSEQLAKNIAYIGPKYKARKFIAYFQNYSNTYLPPENFQSALDEAAQHRGIVGITVSTRPDCISDAYLNIAREIQETYPIDLVVEMGLQTANYKTLSLMNRGHTLAEFIDAVLRVKAFHLQAGAHVMLGLPWDTEEDVRETAKILSALQVDNVKLHALYILRNTQLADWHRNKNFTLKTKEQFVEEAILFLRYLSPDIPVQRLLGRAPEEETVFCNWGNSWRKIHDEIVYRMTEKNIKQGDLCDYLGGKAVRRFLQQK